ncbi:MAG: hypothetical protein A2542_02710 [Parcubacteria group bacterium RIFOXYD2_FULL_52_8]|nr:MAG: hypothetical protein A2542_02710 [Parcubacteria group bacterium RIFOXYD2_FULL_52_8]
MSLDLRLSSGITIIVTEDRQVHIFGADHVVGYGNRRVDGTRLITHVDNNCPHRTLGGQVIKFLYAPVDDDSLVRISGGEAAATLEVAAEGDLEGQAVLAVRPDGTPGHSQALTVVGPVKLLP